MRTFPVVVGLGCLLALSGCAKRDERRASQPPPAAEWLNPPNPSPP